MSDDMTSVVVLRNIAGYRPGQVVDVRIDDERWASKVTAGNAAYLDNVVDAVIASDDTSTEPIDPLHDDGQYDDTDPED